MNLSTWLEAVQAKCEYYAKERKVIFVLEPSTEKMREQDTTYYYCRHPKKRGGQCLFTACPKIRFRKKKKGQKELERFFG